MELKSLDLRKTYHPKTFKELSESQVSQLTDLGRSSPQSSGFANLKDTYAVHRLQQFRDSESSSSIELDKADDSAFQRSFRAIQGQRVGFTATDNIIDDDITESEDGQEKENNMAYNWEPSNAIQQEMMGISSSTKTKDWVNNTGVETTAMAGNDKLHLIPTATRESTPDSIGFSNQLTMGDNTNRPERTVNAANVQNNQLFERQSMRNVLVERIETDATDLQFRDPALQAESGVNDQNIDEKEGGSMCLAKGIIFVLMVLALIGAIIGVTLYLKNEPSPKHEALGKVIPNEITHSECNPRRLSLGDNIEIICVFDIDHEYRKNLIQVNEVVIDSPMKLNDDSFSRDKLEGGRSWNFTGPKARCTSEGRYDLKFYSSLSNQTIVYRTSVTVRLNDGDFTLSWSQRMVNNINGSTEFDVTCNTAGSCHNYDVDFIGKRQSYSAYELLNERKNCSSSFNDKDGRQISCTTQFDEATVNSFFGFIGCRVQDGNFVDYRALNLPACFQTTECNFNCSTKSPERISLDNGGCSHSKIRRCFPAARPIFRRQVCPSDGDCSAYVEQYECRLGWCRSPTGVIYFNELVGELLCGDFVVKIPRTPEITTTTPTTTKTTPTTTTTTPTTTTATPTTTTTTPTTTTTTPTTTTTQVRQTSSELS